MIKKSMIIVIISLLLASCAERGQPQVPHRTQKITNNNTSVSEKRTNIPTLSEKGTNIPTLTVRANTLDSTQNKISGGLILLIGALILL